MRTGAVPVSSHNNTCHGPLLCHTTCTASTDGALSITMMQRNAMLCTWHDMHDMLLDITLHAGMQIDRGRLLHVLALTRIGTTTCKS